ncbi:MAG: GrpB family protein [Oligoflexia bacterium]|nr:GrpB family protein [Oligoflexia bacterium]
MFRDILNSKPEFVKRYNQLKLSLIGTKPEEYRAQKSKFIEEILSSFSR